MKNIILIVLSIIFCKLDTTFSQDTLTLLNGKKLAVRNAIADSAGNVNYFNSKGKLKKIEINDVFSLKDDKGEKIFYKPDTAKDAFSVIQMKSFVHGEYDAYLKHKDNFMLRSSSYITGFASPMLLPVAGIGPAFSPIIPLGYCTLVGTKKIKTGKLHLTAKQLSDEYYVAGYKEAIKRKRIQQAILGSGIGLLLGLATSFIVYDHALK